MIGRTVSRYEILGELGGGGMGVVYKALDRRLGRTVALKFLPPHLSASATAKERFVQEAKAASALDHRNICTVHDIGEHDGQLFIAMAYYPGQTLRTKLENGPLEVGEALEVATQIAEGLASAHEAGIVHRDVKPANVMLTTRGDVKIVDFGLAKMPDKDITESGTLMGTAAYMSPEQVRGEKIDARTDVWSLGVVLYEMLTGKQPFRGESGVAVIRAIESEEPPALVDFPTELSAIVHRAMQKDPKLRYPSMSALREELQAVRLARGSSRWDASSRARTPGRRVRRLHYAVASLLLLGAVAVFGYLFSERSARVRWAREEALPEIERLADAMSVVRESHFAWPAFELAERAERAIPGDGALERLWPRIARDVSIDSTPSGAHVFLKPYSAPERDWLELGATPLTNLPLPLGFARIRVEKPGYGTVEDLVWITDLESQPAVWAFDLDEEGSLPDEMVRFPGERRMLRIPGLDVLEVEAVEPFLIDRYEVTNEEFKRFVDSGGYRKPDFWREPFVRDGKRLSWDEAMAFFRDETGRPGPSTWQVGDYPRGEDDHPVAGVSWYEAAAYAVFREKSLPTIFHWNLAAWTWTAAEVVPLSNFSGEGTVPVGSRPGMNRMGTFDLAGNVREWLVNPTAGDDRRFILGGGWNDPGYSFNGAYAQSPWDRSPSNGFRCIRHGEREDRAVSLAREIDLPFRDFFAEEVVSDEVFEIYLSQFTYHRGELAASIDSEIREEDGILETISFNAAYGGERMVAHLLLPETGNPPHQVVVLFPGSAALDFRSSRAYLHNIRPGWEFLLKSGRAVMLPVYKGTLERGDGRVALDDPGENTLYKDHVILWAKDFSRAVDYLETRSDVDAGKLAYLGLSWGGLLGAIVPAVERRIDAVVLVVAGLDFHSTPPEVDALHYVPRVTQPVLMLNGEYDYYFPLETSQRPMFELLGTPDQHKKWLVFPGTHYVPQTEAVRETLDWLDRYLGPVE